MSRRAVQAEAAALINANSKMSARALKKTLKATNGLDIGERTCNRMINEERKRDANSITEDVTLLASYLDSIGKDNGNVVDHEVSAQFPKEVDVEALPRPWASLPCVRTVF